MFSRLLLSTQTSIAAALVALLTAVVLGVVSGLIAGYYQGLGSVRSRGLYDDTKQYVTNVQSLKTRVGG